MSLGSPSGFGIFRHVYFCGHVKVALSAYLQGHQPPTCPWNFCQCFCFWIPPCTASQTCVGFPQPHELVLCVAGLLHLFAFVLAHRPTLYVLGLVCTSRGLCVLASAPGARPLHWGACVHLSRLSRPTLYAMGFVCSSFGSLGLPYATHVLCTPKRWCCESAALNMPANLENSAVATGLEKINFHFNPK